MHSFSRRRFLARAPATATAFASTGSSKPHEKQKLCLPLINETVDLCGRWMFRLDPDRRGESEGWKLQTTNPEWRQVKIPHTWQVEPANIEYRGLAWYRKTFDVPGDWSGHTVRIEFEAVFHSASVWINGKKAGDHKRKGYTAFVFDISNLLEYGSQNLVTVMVDNDFDEHMLPRGHSSDWAHDGGIYRPVRLHISPATFIERVHIDSIPDFKTGSAALEFQALINTTARETVTGELSYQVVSEESGVAVLSRENASSFSIHPGSSEQVTLEAHLAQAYFWHFDNPHLYRLDLTCNTAAGAHVVSVHFGIRKLEVRNGAFYFNNERVLLMGVERMAGSNPEWGMAEPSTWIERDHHDLKNLNCVFTRVHWPQDKRVLEFCDRHGILLQSEVPAWGPNTFKGMSDRPDADILQNGLEQLREMIGHDYNHPCIVSWGLCNEIDGQNPPAYAFAQAMLQEAKRLDPQRLCSYASHSLFHTQVKDVSGLMDFVECNQYYGSWQKGGPADLDRLLDEIHQAFPDKPVLISEYGYCACTADRPEGDGRRTHVLRTQDEVLRKKPYVAGAIFFCYNDYRTHVGDRGTGVMKQRVHGVVDLYGRPKLSYGLLRSESSPLESAWTEDFARAVVFKFRTRIHLPAYTLRGYMLRAISFGDGDIPISRQELPLPDLVPGSEASMRVEWDSGEPIRIVFDLLRPTGHSAWNTEWKR